LAEQLERYRWFIVAILAVPLLSGLLFIARERLDSPAPLEVAVSESPLGDIRVYVAGAVRNPGVYPMPEDARWIDALEAAGGPAPDADLNAINLARRVYDEDQIIVPRTGQTAVAGAMDEPLININTAGEAELDSLPGIGEVRAGRIIESRSSEGPFTGIEELVTRKLIPQSVFEQIRPLITAQ
jgi:competence protein ComEA